MTMGQSNVFPYVAQLPQNLTWMTESSPTQMSAQSSYYTPFTDHHMNYGKPINLKDILTHLNTITDRFGAHFIDAHFLQDWQFTTSN